MTETDGRWRHASGDDDAGCIPCWLDQDEQGLTGPNIRPCTTPEDDPVEPGLCRYCSHTVERCGMTRTEPCLLCGGVITADPADPFAAVLAHVRTERHRLASDGFTWLCPDCRMVTIPVQRDRCHGCRRSRELVAA